MQFTDHLDLRQGFKKYFRIDAALDESLKDDDFRIRHSRYIAKTCISSQKTRSVGSATPTTTPAWIVY